MTATNEDRCTATTTRGIRCRGFVVFWHPLAGPDPRLCGTHLFGDQRAALEEAHRAAHEALLASLPEANRQAIRRRADIFTRGEPACWSWPTEAPAFESAAAGLSLAALNLIRAAEGGEETLVLTAWQDGRCAICEDRDELVEDHDHATGLVRGYLCRSCNTKEGLDQSGVGMMSRYRQRHPTSILGMTIRYYDRFLGRYASPAPSQLTWENNPMRGIGL